MTWAPGQTGNAGGLTAAASAIAKASRGAVIATLSPALAKLLKLVDSQDEKIALAAAATLARLAAPLVAPSKTQTDDPEAGAGAAHFAALQRKAASRRVISDASDSAHAVDVQVVCTLPKGAKS